MPGRLTDIRGAIRRLWPHAWTEAGFHERLDAPEGSPTAWRPWWSSLGRRVSVVMNPRRWSAQAYNERLAERQRRPGGRHS